MGTFDGFLRDLGDVASDIVGDDGHGEGGGSFWDLVTGGDSYGDDADSSGGSTSRLISGLRSYFGDGSDDETGAGMDDDDTGGSGVWDLVGRMIDRGSGDGGRGDLFGSLLHRVAGAYLPDEIRSQRGSPGDHPSSGTGRLVDPSSTARPDGGRSAVGVPLRDHGWSPSDGPTSDGPDPELPGYPVGADGDRVPVDYDEMVTGGASSPGYQEPDRSDHAVPDDPTFPYASGPEPPALVEQPDVAVPPADDFERAIDDADQVEVTMDDVFEGPP